MGMAGIRSQPDIQFFRFNAYNRPTPKILCIEFIAAKPPLVMGSSAALASHLVLIYMQRLFAKQRQSPENLHVTPHVHACFSTGSATGREPDDKHVRAFQI
jgi:hypothetical protein